ncbi:MAG: hypothetical protein ACC726_02320, partial [Chloroflexota bacterium]
VIHWLDEAHAFGSPAAYMRSVTEQAVAAQPLARIVAGVEAATTKTMRGRPRDVVGRAVRDALREAAFIFHLVVRLNAAAEDLVRFEGLRLVAITLWMRELTLREELARHTDAAGWGADAETLSGSWHDWRRTIAGLVTSLAHAQEARRRVEDRYLAGRDSLFPELADDWTELAQRGEALSAIGASLRDDAGGQPGVPAAEDVEATLEGRPTVAELAGIWVGLARSEARLFID